MGENGLGVLRMPGPLPHLLVRAALPPLPPMGKLRHRAQRRCVHFIYLTGSPPQESGKPRKAPQGGDHWAWEVMGEGGSGHSRRREQPM